MLCLSLRFILYSFCVFSCLCFVFFKQKTAYEMRISDWSSDVCSSDLLALRYAHVGDAHSKHIAYATGKKCVYGPKFAELDRFSQAFVVFHEVMHHVLAHLEHGALLYKREGARFNFIAFNIACDAIINYVAEALPDVDKSAGSIRYGVRSEE